jgi:signal transduction histidine kinase
VPGQGQLKIAILTFFVTVIVLLFNLYYCNLGLWLIYKNPSATLEGVLEQTQSMMTKQILLSSMAALLLSILVSLSFYKLLGPIYRFKQYFHQLQTGRWTQSCELRQGDELQDVKEAINTTLRLMEERMRSQHEVLVETRQVLDELAGVTTERDKIRELIAKADAEDVEYAKRFGEIEVTRAPEEPVMAGAAAGVEAQPEPSTM